MYDRRPLSAGPVDEGRGHGAPWICDSDVLAAEPKGDERCKFSDAINADYSGLTDV
jgi:hypothetical protein